jgi:preprotein translocase subunit SecD
VRGAAPSRSIRLGLAGISLWCAVAAGSLWPADSLAGETIWIETRIADARIDPNTKQSIIFVKLTEDSRRLFGELTQKNVGKTVELRVDGQVVMKPVIREPLLAGVFEIAGNRSLNDAKDIAKRLSSGTKIEVVIVSE